MRKIGYLVSLLFAFNLIAQNPSFLWAKQVGRAATTTICYSTKSDNNGNVITVGVFTGIVDFDPGPGTFTMSSFASTNDIFITKLDGNGNLVWAKQIGGASQNDQASELFTDAAGNSYFTGRFGNTVDFILGAGVLNFTANGDDFYVVKMDANGNLVWAKVLSTASSDYGQDICVDQLGNVFAIGRVVGNVDVDPVWHKHFKFFKRIILSRKLDNAGNFIYGKKMDGIAGGQVGPRAVITDSNGNVFVAGDYLGNVDLDPGAGTSSIAPGGPSQMDGLIEKLDANGNFAWAATINGNFDRRHIRSRG